ncbi:MAG: glycosyltransferase family 2 protein [Lactococcus sp.]|uniref:O antigen biosynthesis rhamnosyltransferase RfbN n=1 Tax=Pseudolactococcus piscium MKFS47 TaxID=297352 RepID=A0A0D6DZG8_9LACT|nr:MULTISPECIES: glycosyltransferase family 2 protein [Lactococcus]MBQ2635522.1 glycosyltransferase family 2 protein [Methanobrevibacter sp.]MDN5403147.1 glycosyltransferase family 2 protein [Lactococcus sp.]MDN5411641.1 glycosyltransferase family 2 protein [Lactococcus sp.]MDN5461235.1 glycosyltransferase family 2 protein [Lactococcus sp.]MDN5465259.1 glycosyltransferase family 2 protein [Lactococcus sp.]
MDNLEIKATIFIPVYNGEKDHLEETLTAIFQQKTDFKYNVLIIDSGSRDRSVAIIQDFCEKYDNIIFQQIENSEYSHGGTRQKAAEMADGEFMVYLSQDAIPANEDWLVNLLSPFDKSPQIAAVLGRQIPRKYCFPLQKKDINAVFAAQGVSGATTIYASTSSDLGRACFYSDVCSAARRSILVNDIPYRNISYAEDQAFGKDIIQSGYLKAYSSESIVIHSNDIKLNEYKGRILDEMLGLEKTGVVLAKPSKKDLIKAVTIQSWQDSSHALKDSEYSKFQKIYYAISAPLFRLARWQGMHLAFKHEDKHSLESVKKNS